MRKAKALSLRRKKAMETTQYITAWGAKTSPVKQRHCSHEWVFDGQTLTAVRQVCTKCALSKLVA